jgi:Zn-dependent protease with chaperone function
MFLATGASARCRDIAISAASRLRRAKPQAARTEVVGAPGFAATAAFYVLYTSAMVVWWLPVGLADLATEHRFGFSHESLALFLRDTLVGLALSWALVPIIWLAYRVYARWPRSWWLIIWSVMVPVTVVVTVVYPLVVTPLYNHYTPLPPGRLRTAIVAIAQRAGIPNPNVLVEDTSRRTAHVNAYVTGFGPSTRIVINDTALRELPEDQILAMVGHELGHYAERHVLVLAVAAMVGTGLILWLVALIVPRLAARYGRTFRLRGPDDLTALPLVMLAVSLISLIGAPIGNGLSRYLERRADAYGLRATGLNEATARLMVGFAERDLADPDPPPLLQFWFGTHPTLAERIDFALRFPRAGSPRAAGTDRNRGAPRRTIRTDRSRI